MYLVGEQWKHDCAKGYRKLLGSKQAVVFRWLLDLGDNQTLQAVIHDIAKIDDRGKTVRKNKNKAAKKSARINQDATMPFLSSAICGGDMLKKKLFFHLAD